jgi:lysophospholipase L1-like esterase
MCSWILTTRALALVVLAAPMLAGNDTNYTYLALGDSIAFGYNPLLFFPFVSESSPPPTPAQFMGYPEVVAQIGHLLQSKKEVNAACPGETSGSFISGTAPDNGCYGKGPGGQPPFKSSIGLHTSYMGSQLAFAVSQLTSNKHINLVTLGIGGNDLLLVDQQCTANPSPFKSFSLCVTGNLLGDETMHIPSVLQSYAANLTYILATLRAHYAGTLVLVKNYSPSADPLFIGAVAGLDQVMMQVGTPFGVKIADGFTAFQIASAPYHGNPCTAGLLIRLSAATCDVHPSTAGRNLLAATVVVSAIGDNGNQEGQSGGQSGDQSGAQ